MPTALCRAVLLRCIRQCFEMRNVVRETPMRDLISSDARSTVSHEDERPDHGEDALESDDDFGLSSSPVR